MRVVWSVLALRVLLDNRNEKGQRIAGLLISKKLILIAGSKVTPTSFYPIQNIIVF